MAPEPEKAFKNPTYRQVCSGTSGHVEVLDIELNNDDPSKTAETFEELIKFLMQFHDPTTKNSQGNDSGFQYASVIFTDDDQQAEIAHRVLNQTQQLLTEGKITTYSENFVQTFLSKYNTFHEAHEEHQDYLMKNPSGYCNHYYRFKTWPSLN
jgi:peptide-methionine (S)-S-oxide reductase